MTKLMMMTFWVLQMLNLHNDLQSTAELFSFVNEESAIPLTITFSHTGNITTQNKLQEKIKLLLTLCKCIPLSYLLFSLCFQSSSFYTMNR
jgi:hypothetical protein